MKERVDPRRQKRLDRKAKAQAPRKVGEADRGQVSTPRAVMRFEALDTWFFRESRPMDAIGGLELASVFPPPPRTLLGAVRTAIGDASEADWAAFACDASHALRREIGFADDLGPLRLSGPWLTQGAERLYPAPLFLFRRPVGTAPGFARLRVGPAMHTYLGRVRLPALPEGMQGSRPLSHAWLTRLGLEAVLAGRFPDGSDVRHGSKLFAEECRLGIARDNVRRIPHDGLLYQTRHVRPRSDLAIEADIEFAEGSGTPKGLVRFGGEGRLTHLSGVAPRVAPVAPSPTALTKGLILVLLTPARFTDPNSWLPPGFESLDGEDSRAWKGQIAGVDLVLHAAVIGKTQREGGWDMVNRRPRAVQSLIPAGSAYYVTTDNLRAAIQKLHQTQIGEDPALGRGLLACGLWNTHEF